MAKAAKKKSKKKAPARRNPVQTTMLALVPGAEPKTPRAAAPGSDKGLAPAGGSAGTGWNGAPFSNGAVKDGRFNRNFLRARRAVLLRRGEREAAAPGYDPSNHDAWWTPLQPYAEAESYDFLPSESLSRGDIGYGEQYELRLTSSGLAPTDATFIRTKSGRFTESPPGQEAAATAVSEVVPAQEPARARRKSAS
jgi:hypothetical protein